VIVLRVSARRTDYGQVDGVTHSGPNKLVPYFTGATNILYTFGGHAITV
jgi:auxin influx carrier (AUX1 LAX family)